MSNNSLKVVIPARHGSVRLPGKPLLDIGGKPMIVRVCENVKEALPKCEVIVATDDERIAAVVRDFGFCSEMTSLAHVNGTSRIAEVAVKRGWDDKDVIINVQGDEPFLPQSVLRGFIEFLVTQEQLAMATISTIFDSVESLSDPNRVKVITDNKGRAVYFSRAVIPNLRDQKLTESSIKYYRKHVGIYAYSVSAVKQFVAQPPSANELAESLEQLRAIDIGMPIQVWFTKDCVPTGIDTAADLGAANLMF